MPAISQFFKGATTLMTLARAHPAAMKELLVAGMAQPLTRVRFRQLYDIDWSDSGSNRRQQEEDTIFSWEVCLQRCEGMERTTSRHGSLMKQSSVYEICDAFSM